MSTPTVTERANSLEPVTRDDFADSPAPEPHRPGRQRTYRSGTESRRSTERVLASLLVRP
jgi:hypothetical protein